MPGVEAHHDAILRALAPAGLKERLRIKLSHGYTAIQVMERLAPANREALAGGQAPRQAQLPDTKTPCRA